MVFDTREKWIACEDPTAMLRFWKQNSCKYTINWDRKLRLWMLALLRQQIADSRASTRGYHPQPKMSSMEFVANSVEEWLESESYEDWQPTTLRGDFPQVLLDELLLDDNLWMADYRVWNRVAWHGAEQVEQTPDKKVQADLLRDILGNPHDLYSLPPGHTTVWCNNSSCPARGAIKFPGGCESARLVEGSVLSGEGMCRYRFQTAEEVAEEFHRGWGSSMICSSCNVPPIIRVESSPILTPTIRAMAEEIYTTKDFSVGRMGILCDALQDIGLSFVEKCSSCRGTGYAHATLIGKVRVVDSRGENRGKVRSTLKDDPTVCKRCEGHGETPNLLLSHLSSAEQLHVRGCWAIDRLSCRR